LVRTHWHDLPARVRTAVGDRVGPITAAGSASAGRNSEIAATLDTPSGKVFVKGMRTDNPRIPAQHREAMINPYVLPVAPRLLWHVVVDGWDLMGFEHVEGRPVDLAPGSVDLPGIADALLVLAGLPCPDLPLKRTEQRWADYTDPTELALLRGDTLLHTDLHPDNMLTDGHTVRFVDWAWPTIGAGWIDTAILTLWLITHGHTVHDAESWARRSPWWRAASTEAVDAFTTANSRLWDEIATADPQPWKQRVAAAAQEWSQHRLHGPHR
jgi:hypothetical protein